MKRALKWTLLVVVLLAIVGLGLFLYYIPPFFTIPPEEFGRQMREAAPPVTGIADPAERAIAARGRYIVMTGACIGCHATNGPQGPDLTKYLAGGAVKFQTAHATYVSRNLTPDKDTGLARRTDEDVKRVLRSGVFPDGHQVTYTVMPWWSFSHWSEEDRYAVVVYLRHLPAIRHATPEVVPGNAITFPGATEQDYASRDHGLK
ncbi:MAG TPA: c-type cytochrome [Vicinamibacterales bacterium]|jgi:mono/diheme cytochrome c family protein